MDGLKVHYLTWRCLEMCRDGEQQHSACLMLTTSACLMLERNKCGWVQRYMARENLPIWPPPTSLPQRERENGRYCTPDHLIRNINIVSSQAN